MHDIATGSEGDRHALRVGDHHLGLELSQGAVGSPVLGQLDTGPGQLTGVGFQLGFQAFKQGKGIRRRPGNRARDGGIAVGLRQIGLDPVRPGQGFG